MGVEKSNDYVQESVDNVMSIPFLGPHIELPANVESRDLLIGKNSPRREKFIALVDALDQKKITFDQAARDVDLDVIRIALYFIGGVGYESERRLRKAVETFLFHYKKHRVALESKYGRDVFSTTIFAPQGGKGSPDFQDKVGVDRVDAGLADLYHALLDKNLRCLNGDIDDFVEHYVRSAIVNEKWRLFFEKRIKGLKQKVANLYSEYWLNDVSQGQAFDYLASSKKKGVEIKQEMENLIEEAYKTRKVKDYADRQHNKQILALANNAAARKYLVKAMQPLENFFKKAKDTDEIKRFRANFISLQEYYFAEDSGILADSEYEFTHSLRAFGYYISRMAPQGEKYRIFRGDSYVEKDGRAVYGGGVLDGSLDLGDILKKYDTAFFPGIVAGAEMEFANLQMKMYKAGLDMPLPGKFETNPEYLIDNIKRCARTYELIKNKNFGALRRYIKNRISDDRRIDVVSKYFDKKSPFVVSDKGQKYVSRLTALKGLMQAFNVKWLDPATGVFADTANFAMPEAGVYKVMQALDEAEQSFGYEARKFFEQLGGEQGLVNEVVDDMENYPIQYYGMDFYFINFLNSHHVEVFRALFPDWK